MLQDPCLRSLSTASHACPIGSLPGCQAGNSTTPAALHAATLHAAAHLAPVVLVGHIQEVEPRAQAVAVLPEVLQAGGGRDITSRALARTSDVWLAAKQACRWVPAERHVYRKPWLGCCSPAADCCNAQAHPAHSIPLFMTVLWGSDEWRAHPCVRAAVSGMCHECSLGHPPEHRHGPGPSLAPIRSRQSPTLSDRLSSTRPQLQ